MQHQETKTAFYAGAFEAFNLMAYQITDLDEGDAEKALSNLQEEITAWLDADIAERHRQVGLEYTSPVKTPSPTL